MKNIQMHPLSRHFRPGMTLLFALVLPAATSAQRFVDLNKGNIIYTKRGIMDGNNVRTIFYNHGEVAHWQIGRAHV